MKRKPAKTRKQLEEERNSKIPAIRELRKKGVSITSVALAFRVSTNFVTLHCRDIKIIQKRRGKENSSVLKNVNPCETYTFDQLSPEDKKRYMELVPPKKEDENKSFIIGRKDKYWKAAIFEDSYSSNQNYKY